jgi:uncharacterized protein involved in copper resistance
VPPRDTTPGQADASWSLGQGARRSVAERGVGAVSSDAAPGLRLRYEIGREFAPYASVSRTGRLARTAAFARDDEAVDGRAVSAAAASDFDPAVPGNALKLKV